MESVLQGKLNLLLLMLPKSSAEKVTLRKSLREKEKNAKQPSKRTGVLLCNTTQ